MTARPVVFEFQGETLALSVDEARALISTVGAAINALRVKCPTCRCRLLPVQSCGCCNEPDLGDDLEPFV